MERRCWSCRFWEAFRRDSGEGKCVKIVICGDEKRLLNPTVFMGEDDPGFGMTWRDFGCVWWEPVEPFVVASSVDPERWGVTANFAHIPWSERRRVVFGIPQEEAEELCAWLNEQFRKWVE